MNPIRRLLGRLVWPEAVDHRDARTVVCHEWFAVLGGSDKVAAEITGLAEAEVVYTFAAADECLEALEIACPVVTWRFGRWAGRAHRFKLLLPVMPIVWWSLDLERASTVVTSSHSCVNAVRSPNAYRLSYCHTPMRYAWEWRLEQGRMPRWARPSMRFGAAVLRWLDRRWSRQVDVYVANSNFVADRIRRSYRRDAVVVAPPVDVDRFRAEPTSTTALEDAPFITAGRLVPYKRFDLAVEAANVAGVDLIVAGSGPDLRRLQSLAGPTVSFVEQPSDDQLADLLANSAAFLFCGVEDFGMLPVEAQACGTPVIARRVGGALDSVVEGVTGELIDTDHVDQWAAALVGFDRSRYDRDTILRHAKTFDLPRFADEMRPLLIAPTGRHAPIDGSMISVLIPAHNEEDVIADAIDSINRQGVEGIEILVVDDRCSDATAQVAGALPNVRVVACEGAGGIDARNTGLRHARPIVVLLDADDRHEPLAVERLVRPLIDDPDAGLVGGSVREVTHDGRLISTWVPPRDGRHAAFQLCAEPSYSHSAVAVRRDAVLSIGSYSSAHEYAQDYDLFQRLSAANVPMIGIDECVVERVVRPASISAANWESQAASMRDISDAAVAVWEAGGGTWRTIVELGREIVGLPRREIQVAALRVARTHARHGRHRDASKVTAAALLLGPVSLIRGVSETLRSRRTHRIIWGVDAVP